MVEPEVFFMNPQTASSNHYQVDDDSISTDEILKQAKEEFNTFKNALTKNGVSVLSMKGSKECPDHIFPNWFITFENKTFQIFSMLAENRRKEKTPKMIEKLSEEYKLTCDLSSHESRNIFLESTSSMVFDRVNRIVYLTISPRANAGLANEWCNENNYELVKPFLDFQIKERGWDINRYTLIVPFSWGLCPTPDPPGCARIMITW